MQTSPFGTLSTSGWGGGPSSPPNPPRGHSGAPLPRTTPRKYFDTYPPNLFLQKSAPPHYYAGATRGPSGGTSGGPPGLFGHPFGPILVRLDGRLTVASPPGRLHKYSTRTYAGGCKCPKSSRKHLFDLHPVTGIRHAHFLFRVWILPSLRSTLPGGG